MALSRSFIPNVSLHSHCQQKQVKMAVKYDRPNILPWQRKTPENSRGGQIPKLAKNRPCPATWEDSILLTVPKLYDGGFVVKLLQEKMTTKKYTELDHKKEWKVKQFFRCCFKKAEGKKHQEHVNLGHKRIQFIFSEWYIARTKYAIKCM